MSRVTVVVPVRNEAACLERTLRSLLDQDFPADRFEVIVADGLSTDGTVPVVRRLQAEYANLKFVYNPGKLSSAARNLGVRHAAGDVTVVVDGHCHVPDKLYLRKLAAGFAESGADCLGRPQPLDVPDPTVFQRAVAVARSSRLGHNPDSHIYAAEPAFVAPHSTAVAYSEAVFARVGLFDERFDACEDVEFNHRVAEAGLRCYFTPAVKIVYHPRGTPAALFMQLARYGAGRARLAGKHPRSLTLPALVPPVWLVAVVCGALVAPFAGPAGWAYPVMLAAYFAAIVGVSLALGRGQPAGVARRLPVAFMSIHLGFACGFLREAAAGAVRSYRRWRPSPI